MTSKKVEVTDAVVAEEQPLVSVEDVQEMISTSKLDRLSEQASNGVINPIVLAKFLNIAPQQVYNRIKAGKIQIANRNSTQKIVIPLGEALEFAANYLDKKARKQAQIEAELAGK